MQRISVLLPEPDGPQITMRSPRGDGEVDVAQHVELAEPLVDAVELDDGALMLMALAPSLDGRRLGRRRRSLASVPVLRCCSSQRL